MADIRLKDGNGVPQTYPGVTKVVLKDTNGDDVAFEQAVAGTSKITLISDGATFQTISVRTGGSVDYADSPTSAGKAFIGWATTPDATVPNITFPITASEDISIYAVYATWRCTVANLGASSPSSVTFTHQGTMPTFEEVTFNGDVFIKFPTMYRKVVGDSSDQITSFIISTAKEDAGFHPYPCFVKEDDISVMPYVLMGKYCSTSSSTANSVSGEAAYAGIGTARTICRNRGTGYQQYDWMFQSLWKELLICKMQTINTNSGSGITTDVLGIVWNQGTIYNLSFGIDGVTWAGDTKRWAICYHPSQYADSATSSTTGYRNASYSFYSSTTGSEISKLGYDPNNEFFNYPASTVSNSSYNTYYCDSYVKDSSDLTACGANVGKEQASCGAFYLKTDNVNFSTSMYIRLCYRPIGG